MPSPPFLDEINLGIVRHLWNGRKPYAEIAKDLGITTTTVRRRVNRLQKKGILCSYTLNERETLPKELFQTYKPKIANFSAYEKN